MAETAEKPRFVHTLLGSALSGFLARIPCHPLDTIKSRLQSSSGSRYKGILHCFQCTWAEEGLRGLYRGFGIVASAGAPGACVYISSYEVFKSYLTGDSDMDFLGHLAAGMGAEAAACIIFVPVDVIKERLQVQRRVGLGEPLPGDRVSSTPPSYRGSLDAIRTISRTEGLLGLYKGYYATLASFGPFSALYFAFYEQARRLVAAFAQEKDPKKLPPTLTLSSSAFAGAAASVITCPLDLAKLRLQTQIRLKPGAEIPEGHLHGLGDAMSRLWREAGLRGLFRGAGARAAFHVPSTCITFTAFEECRKVMQKVEGMLSHSALQPVA